MSDSFYRAFEDRHRGSREIIQARQESWLPFLRALREHESAPALIDIGCGRGEWLALARGEGWRVQGVDLDDAMLAACREAGLDVHRGDALEFLRGLKDAGVNAVTGFHVAEHMPFDVLRELVAQAHRVLRPGGLLILETPNPENLVVGSSAFHMDPTHVKPLPPALLAFVAEFAGFARVATLRLHEGLAPDAPAELIDVLAGVSPDYAIVALKAGGVPSPALDELLSSRTGVALNELAQRYDRQRNARMREVQVAAEIARELGTQLATRIEALEHTKTAWVDFERAAVDRVFELQHRLQAMEHSTSWRVTAPVRWAGAQRLALRQRGVKGTVRAAVTKPLRVLDRVLLRMPRLRSMIAPVARAVGLRTVIPRPPIIPPPPPLDPHSMTQDARRVHDSLRRALDTAARKDH
jgi:O-antigen chain-terminating methyltransferase